MLVHWMDADCPSVHDVGAAEAPPDEAPLRFSTSTPPVSSPTHSRNSLVARTLSASTCSGSLAGSFCGISFGRQWCRSLTPIALHHACYGTWVVGCFELVTEPVVPELTDASSAESSKIVPKLLLTVQHHRVDFIAQSHSATVRVPL